MINEHDLEDFPRASNSEGWVVQQLIKGVGWQVVEGPFPLRETAYTVMEFYLIGKDGIEYRVYESLKF